MTMARCSSPPSSGRKATTSASSAPGEGNARRADPLQRCAGVFAEAVDVRERHRHHVVLARPPAKGFARLGVEAAQEDGGEQAREFGERHRARILRVGDLGTRRARRRSDGARRRVGKAADMRCVERESQRQRHHTPGDGGAQSARAPRRQRQTSPSARQRCEGPRAVPASRIRRQAGPRRHVRRRPAQRCRRAAGLPRRGPPRTRREASPPPVSAPAARCGRGDPPFVQAGSLSRAAPPDPATAPL